jgi:hypothetical protein
MPQLKNVIGLRESAIITSNETRNWIGLESAPRGTLQATLCVRFWPNGSGTLPAPLLDRLADHLASRDLANPSFHGRHVLTVTVDGAVGKFPALCRNSYAYGFAKQLRLDLWVRAP